MPASCVPQIVKQAGLPSRFRYWSGRGDTRYLFTRTDLPALDHFDEAVVVIVRYGRIIWVGYPQRHDSGSDLAVLAKRDGSQIYIHLLARTAARRAEIVNDLSAVIHVEQIDIAGPARILEFPVAA